MKFSSIKLIIVILFFGSAIILFLVKKNILNSNFRYIPVLIGVISSLYILLFSFVKNIQLKKDALKKYFITSDVIFYLASGQLVLIAIADNPIFIILGVLIATLNLVYLILFYFNKSSNSYFSKQRIITHILLLIVISLINRY
jgi:hypothetical protein